MIITVAFDLDVKEAKALRIYRKFLNTTRGTHYGNVQEMLDVITKRYLDSCIKQMQQKRRDKVSKAYRRVNEVKQAEVDAILEVTDDE